MVSSKAIDLLFGGMEQQGPGSNAHTLHVLGLLPQQEFPCVVDAGCGTGRSTIALAKALGTRVHGVDSHGPFLADLERRAQAAGVGDLVQTHCMDMADIPKSFPAVNLLWSEGAAYSIGFPRALALWASAVVPGGFVVASESVWLSNEPTEEVKEFWEAEYPDMRSVEENLALAAQAGYAVFATHPLPPKAWVEGYYDVLGPRAESLLHHQDAEVRGLALQILQEIEIFKRSEGSYGYVFFVLQRAGRAGDPQKEGTS